MPDGVSQSVLASIWAMSEAIESQQFQQTSTNEECRSFSNMVPRNLTSNANSICYGIWFGCEFAIEHTECTVQRQPADRKVTPTTSPRQNLKVRRFLFVVKQSTIKYRYCYAALPLISIFVLVFETYIRTKYQSRPMLDVRARSLKPRAK